MSIEQEVVLRLKYRVWDKENNCWFVPTHGAYKGNLEELLLQPNGDLILRYMWKGQIKSAHESTFSGRFEVNWFIGRYDKEGNEVYVGDILEDETGNPAFKLNRDVVKFWASDEVGNCGCCYRVDFDGSAFGIEHGAISQRKIIGNIYQNSELVPREEEES